MGMRVLPGLQILLVLGVFAAFRGVGVRAHSADEMPMTDDGPMDLMVGNALTFLHFKPGDNLW
jgi:hypothetical protein